ncbi:MAG: transporter [Candidatus Caenarcaniphilales bacterium]|nr:transporter [Candidatus Caenarcaniphilales bacterium]
MPAYTLPKGVFGVGVGTSYVNSGRHSRSQFRGITRRDEHGDSVNSNLTANLNIAYGITDDLSLTLFMPYIMGFGFQEMHDGELEDLGNSIGFGDLTSLLQYRFYENEESKLQSAFIAGMKFPTGFTGVTSNEGELFEATNQPGSGSWDPLFGLAVSKTFKNDINLDANFLYRLTTEGAQNTDVGDVANYNVALSYPIHHTHDNPFSHRHSHDREKGILHKLLPEHILGQYVAWDMIFEVNTIYQSIPEESGVKIENHGGTTVFLSPGVRMTFNDRVVFNLSVGFPVIEVLDGEQGGSDFRLFAGLATSFGGS